MELTEYEKEAQKISASMMRALIFVMEYIQENSIGEDDYGNRSEAGRHYVVLKEAFQKVFPELDI